MDIVFGRFPPPRYAVTLLAASRCSSASRPHRRFRRRLAGALIADGCAVSSTQGGDPRGTCRGRWYIEEGKGSLCLSQQKNIVFDTGGADVCSGVGVHPLSPRRATKIFNRRGYPIGMEVSVWTLKVVPRDRRNMPGCFVPRCWARVFDWLVLGARVSTPAAGSGKSHHMHEVVPLRGFPGWLPAGGGS